MEPSYERNEVTVWCGDALAVLRELPSESVQMICTSPPYFGLRSYGSEIWEGGDPECKHQTHSRDQSQGVTSQRHGRSNTEAQRNDELSSICPICGAVRAGDPYWGGDPACQHELGETVFVDVRDGGPPDFSTGRNRGEKYGRNSPRGQYCQSCNAWRGQLGLEPTLGEYIAHLSEVFAECRRVLRRDGTLWLNLGDSFASSGRGGGNKQETNVGSLIPGTTRPHVGFKQKDLMGVPWRVAIALQNDGWYLRSDIIWSKGNVMPSSVKDRPTLSHEHFFLLAKSAHYYYDGDAIAERVAGPWKIGQATRLTQVRSANGAVTGGTGKRVSTGPTRNKRDVWQVNVAAYPGAHYAVYPPQLIIPAIKAGSREGDIVLDPFLGSGTTADVARRMGRKAWGIELYPEYIKRDVIPRLAHELLPLDYQARLEDYEQEMLELEAEA